MTVSNSIRSVPLSSGRRNSPLLRMKALRKKRRPLMLRYQDAITVTDTYHETKSRFAWIGEIENEQLLTALETLKIGRFGNHHHVRLCRDTTSLKFLKSTAYLGPLISIKIKRITKFLKNF